MKTPLLQGGLKRIMIGGIPRNICILEGTLAACVILALNNLKAVPIMIIVHVILVYLYKKDEYFIEILVDHIKEDDYLDV
jgi:type IV secretion system protein VirB3